MASLAWTWIFQTEERTVYVTTPASLLCSVATCVRLNVPYVNCERCVNRKRNRERTFVLRRWRVENAPANQRPPSPLNRRNTCCTCIKDQQDAFSSGDPGLQGHRRPTIKSKTPFTFSPSVVLLFCSDPTELLQTRHQCVKHSFIINRSFVEKWACFISTMALRRFTTKSYCSVR